MKLWLLLVALFAVSAYADGEQVTGTMLCPPGMSMITFSVGERTVASVCMSAAELERATYRYGPNGGEIACRVLHVRAK